MSGHDLDVDRAIDGRPEAVFDAFIGLYGDDRPSWITDSELDLRVGGGWSVRFAPPGVPPFREERVITRLDRPTHLEYAMIAIPEDDRPSFDTQVAVAFETDGVRTRVRLAQRGFPTAATRDEFASAWPDVLDLLARRVEG